MIPVIQNSYVSGELSPGFLGRTDKPQYKNGASTMRNMFVRYTGGAYSRAGFAYVGMCKQGAPNPGGVGSLSTPPRDINFQYSINQGFALEFGDQYMRIKSDGAYVVEAANAITAITNASPGVFTYTNTNYSLSNGDWIFIQNAVGMTQFNGLTWIVQNVSGATFTVTDLFGNAVNTTNFAGYISGGTLARIYTVVSPYAAADISYLKFTQNANLMNLVCWNQVSKGEYPPYTLQRITNTNWTFTVVSFDAAISPPTTVNATATSSTTQNTWYSYAVTSVDGNGNESVASTPAYILNNDISINAGSNTITWSHVANAVSSNIYAAIPIFTTAPFSNPGFVGVPYGLIGSLPGMGQQFIDTNIIPDFTVTPPLHSNPFARGQILDVTPTSAGTVSGSPGFLVNTSTGSGFAGSLVLQGGLFVGFDITDNGKNYANADTITITGMSGAAATLTIGAQTGTYPGAVQYYQQRLIYADTINQPDTYFMSQPGLYNNFDASIPTVDSDAIIGTPWGIQINGIQFMVPSIQGLLAFTGNGVWLINGGNSVAITPSNQNAQAQAQIGCSALLPPMYINLHVLYVQAKNAIVRDVSFNFLYNTFVGDDITVFSNHLFLGYQLVQWAYSEEPYKIVWVVRDDGKMLSLTYIKTQEIQGWARHDTNGLFVGVCSVIEPPVDAVYTITKRYIPGTTSAPAGTWAYYSERADNRQWANVEECFCVDAGLSLPMTSPAATLTPAAATGSNVLFMTSSAVFNQIQYIYVTNSQDNTVSVIDPNSNQVIKTITVGIGPQGLAVSPDGTQVWVCNIVSGTVSIISTVSLEVISTISVGTRPIEVVFTPNGVTAYVLNFSALGLVYPVTVSSLIIGSPISVGSLPSGICILPNGVTIYVSSRNDNNVTPITIATNTAGVPIAVGLDPHDLVATPNSSYIYVTNFDDSSVSVIATASNTLSTTIAVQSSPIGITVSPTGTYIYVTNSGNRSVSIINTSSNTITDTISGIGIAPQYPSISANGQFLYVPDANNSTNIVYVISTLTNEIINIIAVGFGPNQTANSSIQQPSIGTIGDVIRVGGGKATITEHISPTQVMADITQDITNVIPDDPNGMPIPSVSGNWTITRPVSVIGGLNHLEGFTVAGLADGGVIVPQVVTNGQITLQEPASAVNIGLAFLPQLQNMPLDVPSQTTTQGRRKDIGAVTVRVEGSRGFSVGSNQTDASWQQNQATVPWTGLKEVKERNALITAGSAIPLFTGDLRIPVPGDWDEKAQTAIMQNYPLPLNVLAIVPEVSLGDNPA